MHWQWIEGSLEVKKRLLSCCTGLIVLLLQLLFQVQVSKLVLSVCSFFNLHCSCFALAFKHQSNMKSTNWLLFSCLFLAGLSKAISGKSSSSKKRTFGGDESSEDWASFSLGMQASARWPWKEKLWLLMIL